MQHLRPLLLSLLLVASAPLLAQDDLQGKLLGTWKMTYHTIRSGETTTAWDMTKATQYKIITPTHWMFVAQDPENRDVSGDGGTYTMTGNKLIEDVPFGRTDFTVRVEGDKYYQDGFIYLNGGNTLELHEVFQRVEEPAGQNPELVGTWGLTSVHHVKEGKSASVAGVSELFIITPSHYMYVTKMRDNFHAARVGSYKKEGNQVVTTPLLSSDRPNAEGNPVVTFAKKKNRLTLSSTFVDGENGRKQERLSVYQPATKRVSKTVSNTH